MTAHWTPELKKSAKIGLIVLTCVNLINYIDRYVVSALVESLKKSSLQLTDVQAGLLMTSFLAVYMLTAPVFGIWGDRGSRTKLMAYAIIVWSAATLGGSIVWSFFSLLVVRALLGIGEAAYGTVAPALLSDYFPPSERGRAFSIFFTAIPVGAALGYIIGGFMDANFGWRSAFVVTSLPGFALSYMVWKLSEPKRGTWDVEHFPEKLIPRRSALHGYHSLLKIRSYAMVTSGYAAYTFAIGALAFWMPAFLERSRGLEKATASTQFGIMVVFTGIFGTLCGGWLSNNRRRRNALTASKSSKTASSANMSADLLISGVATLLSAPFIYLSINAADSLSMWIFMVIGELLVFIPTGLVNAVTLESVPVEQRASATALSMLAIHLFGDVPSPALVGWISDHSNLVQGLTIVPLAAVVGAIVWLIEAYLLKRQAPSN